MSEFKNYLLNDDEISDIFAVATAIRSGEAGLDELDELGGDTTLSEKAAMEAQILKQKILMAQMSLGRTIAVEKITEYDAATKEDEYDAYWGVITKVSQVNDQNMLGYVPGRYFWELGFNRNRLIRSSGRYMANTYFFTRPPARTRGKVIGIDPRNSALVIRPEGLRDRIVEKQWIHLINPDGEPLVKIDGLPGLR